MTNFPLTTSRAEAYQQACAERGPIAFVAVLPSENSHGYHGALGIAVANERGYHPVPLGWARFTTMDAAQANADELNRHIGLSDMTAVLIVASTMGGKPFRLPKPTEGGK